MRYITVLVMWAISSFACLAQNQRLIVTSPSFAEKGAIPPKYSCDGRESSPPLHIENIPAGAQSLAFTLNDLDAPYEGGFIHWVVWNVDVMKDIPENYTGGSKGFNGMGKHKYTGICPSGPHRFQFRVYALDTKMQLDLNTDKATLEQKIQGHILAEGTLNGTYERKWDFGPNGNRVDEKMNR